MKVGRGVEHDMKRQRITPRAALHPRQVAARVPINGRLLAAGPQQPLSFGRRPMRWPPLQPQALASCDSVLLAWRGTNTATYQYSTYRKPCIPQFLFTKVGRCRLYSFRSIFRSSITTRTIGSCKFFSFSFFLPHYVLGCYIRHGFFDAKV